MPLYSTKFHISWLEKIDSDGTPVKRWLKPGSSSSTFICTICKTDELTCGNKGWQSIERHMNNKKHRDNLKLIKENSTFIVRTEPPFNQNPRCTNPTLDPTVGSSPNSDNIPLSEMIYAPLSDSKRISKHIL